MFVSLQLQCFVVLINSISNFRTHAIATRKKRRYVNYSRSKCPQYVSTTLTHAHTGVNVFEEERYGGGRHVRAEEIGFVALVVKSDLFGRKKSRVVKIHTANGTLWRELLLKYQILHARGYLRHVQ